MTRLEQREVAPINEPADAEFEKRWAVWQAKVFAKGARQERLVRPLAAVGTVAIAAGLLWVLFLA